uniref:Uncharacterized protein n=1 Tax=Cyanothece sp. (strain PCC 7425 / ATCC 29141) TaxID=395961 RepID=B8HY88_CYAP4
MTPKSTAFLGVSCVAFIAAVGSVFELSSGAAQLGNLTTAVILALSVPLGITLFIAAVREARTHQG